MRSPDALRAVAAAREELGRALALVHEGDAAGALRCEALARRHLDGLVGCPLGPEVKGALDLAARDVERVLGLAVTARAAAGAELGRLRADARVTHAYAGRPDPGRTALDRPA